VGMAAITFILQCNMLRHLRQRHESAITVRFLFVTAAAATTLYFGRLETKLHVQNVKRIQMKCTDPIVIRESCHYGMCIQCGGRPPCDFRECSYCGIYVRRADSSCQGDHICTPPSELMYKVRDAKEGDDVTSHCACGKKKHLSPSKGRGCKSESAIVCGHISSSFARHSPFIDTVVLWLVPGSSFKLPITT